jgi:hypothetical protein
MCREIQRYHLGCQHWHKFWVIECKTFKAKKEKWLQKQGFWKGLLTPKPHCNTESIKEHKYYWCPFCTRARNLEYPSDEFGEDSIAASSESKVGYKSKFREELLSRGPSSQDLAMPDMSPDLRNSFLELSASQSKNKPGKQLPEIRSNIVNPGINWEQWSHVRDHITPPSLGPPPDKPLPPTPVRRQSINFQKQVASASQGRGHGKNSHRIPRKHVAGLSGESYPRYNSRQIGGPAEVVSPLPRPQTRRKETPLPLILDKNRELPEFLPQLSDPPSPFTPSYLQDARSSNQDPQTSPPPVGRSGSTTNRSREKPNKFQSSSVSLLAPNTDTLIGRYVDVPNRRAQTVSGRHENIRSVHGDRVFISNRLEQEIGDVEDYWRSGGAESSEDNFRSLKGLRPSLSNTRERESRKQEDV